MNDDFDNSRTDREMLAKSQPETPFQSQLLDLVDQVTEDEATVLLRWLAYNRPAVLRQAFREGPERIQRMYISRGRRS